MKIPMDIYKEWQTMQTAGLEKQDRTKGH